MPKRAVARPASPRAAVIARGLRITGRGRTPPVGDVDGEAGARWIRLNGASVFYFISSDGSTVLRGTDFAIAEPLQPGFVAAMARVGGLNAEIEAAWS